MDHYTYAPWRSLRLTQALFLSFFVLKNETRYLIAHLNKKAEKKNLPSRHTAPGRVGIKVHRVHRLAAVYCSSPSIGRGRCVRRARPIGRLDRSEGAWSRVDLRAGTLGFLDALSPTVRADRGQFLNSVEVVAISKDRFKRYLLKYVERGIKGL